MTKVEQEIKKFLIAKSYRTTKNYLNKAAGFIKVAL